MNRYQAVKTAVIGCGAISGIYFHNMIHNFQILDVVGCCDLNEDAAGAASSAYGIPVLTKEAILNDPGIELVVNLTGPSVHYPVIKELLEHGKHVYTEKVLATDIDQAQELILLAQKQGVLLCCAPDTFLGAGLQTARHLIESGLIGTVTSAVAVLQRDARQLAEKFPFTAKAFGGIGIDVGIYYTTAMISILGSVEEVCGMSGIVFPEQTHYFTGNGNFGETYRQESETYLAGTLRFRSGCIGSLHFNSRSIRTETPYVAFYGTEGILFLEDPNSFGGEVKLLMKGQTTPVSFPHTHGYDGNERGLGVAEMAWALRKGRVPRADAKMARHALEILTGIVRSGETRCFYSLRSAFELPPVLPRGYLGGQYAGNQAEGGIALEEGTMGEL